MTTGSSLLQTALGLNRSGRLLYGALFVLAIPALVGWFVFLPRLRFSEQDEQLFRAARHGDRTAIERALADGADVNASSPIDGKTALFRAAVFGHADVVQLLLDHGADSAVVASDGRSALEVVQAARSEEKDPAIARQLDAVASILQGSKGRP